jgi:hypothetical protein
MIEQSRKLIFSFSLIVFLFAAAYAQPELDPSFGSQGKVVTTFARGAHLINRLSSRTTR